MNNSDLAKAWVELQKLPQGTPESEALMWAAKELNLLAMRKPKQCWNIVLEVLSITDDEWVLTNLAAGPIENMLVFDPEGTMFLIENECKENKKLRGLIKDIWKNLIPDDVWHRLQKLGK